MSKNEDELGGNVESGDTPDKDDARRKVTPPKVSSRARSSNRRDVRVANSHSTGPDLPRSKQTVNFLIYIFDWVRNLMRHFENTDFPDLDIGIWRRIAAALLGCAILVSSGSVALAAARPAAFYAIRDSFINAALVSYSAVVILVSGLVALSLLVQKFGTFYEHLKRACVYPILLVILAMVPACILIIVLRILAVVGATFT